MFGKTFKKVISVFVIAMFILSLVPAISFAEVTEGGEESGESTKVTGTIPVTDWLMIRGDSDTNKANTQYFPSYGYRMNGGTYRSFAKIDLTAYKDFLKLPKTTIKFTWTAGSKKGPCFSVYAMSSKADPVSFGQPTVSTAQTPVKGLLSYNDAVQYDMDKYNSESLLFEYDNSTENGGTGSLESGNGLLNMAVLNSALADDSNPNDYILTLGFTNIGMTKTSDCTISKSISFEITYYTDDKLETDAQYIDRIIRDLTLKDLIPESEDGFIPSGTELLPTYGDLGIEWSVDSSGYLSEDNILSIPDNKQISVILSAKFTKNSENLTRTYPATIYYDLTNIKDGSSTISTNGSANRQYTKQEVESNGLGGKLSDDKYIKYTDCDGNPYFNLGGGAATEFSILLTEDCDNNGVSVSSSLYGNTAGTEKLYIGFSFNKDGMSVSYDDVNETYAEMPLNEWVNIAIVAPTGLIPGTETYDKTWEVYVNGEVAYTGRLTSSTTNKGFEYNRISGKNVHSKYGWVDDEETGEQVWKPLAMTDEEANLAGIKTSIYIDNIRNILAGSTYVPGVNEAAPLKMSAYALDKAGKTITLAEAITVEALKSDMVTDEFTSVRVYDGEDNLLDDEDTLADGYRVVLATTNQTLIERTYSYYYIRIADDETEFDIPVLSIDAEGNVTTSITAHNYTGEDAQYKVYLAKYTDSTLTSVSPLTFTAEKDKATTDTSLTATLEKGETAKLFIWSGVENDYTPITAAKSVTK